MKENVIREDSAQMLCTSCGLCCDGSVFNHAQIYPEDDKSLLTKCGITVRKRGDRRFFILPCHHLHERKCAIYTSWRPSICSRFKCKVLKRLEKGEISFMQGLEIINMTLQHLTKLRQQIQPGGYTKPTNIAKMFEAWKKRQENPDAAVMLNFAAFQFRLSRDFGKGKK